MATLSIFSLGLLYANFVEWFVHKYLFHGLGKKQRSLFAFHLREHHIHNQNKSWNVVFPFTDLIAGTLEERRDEG